MTKDSTADDICFKTNLSDFALQILGGLKTENVLFVTNDGNVARDRAITVIYKWRELLEVCE